MYGAIRWGRTYLETPVHLKVPSLSLFKFELWGLRHPVESPGHLKVFVQNLRMVDQNLKNCLLSLKHINIAQSVMGLKI